MVKNKSAEGKVNMVDKKRSGFKVPVQTGQSVKQTQERLKNSRSGGGDNRLLLLKDGDEARIRFLGNTEEWVNYGEHYSKTAGYIPCIGEEDGCNFCDDDQYASDRALVNVYVYNVERAPNKGNKAKNEKIEGVRLLKMTQKIQTDLTARAARLAKRDEELTDRDATIIRSGEQTDTNYTIDWDEKKTKVPSGAKKDKIDIIGYLEERVNSYYGPGTKKKSSKRDVDDDDMDMDDQDDDEELDMEDNDDDEEEEEEEEEKPKRKLKKN